MAIRDVAPTRVIARDRTPARVAHELIEDVVQAMSPCRDAEEQLAARSTQLGARLEESGCQRACRVDEVRAEHDIKSIGQVRRGPVEAPHGRLRRVRPDDVQQALLAIRREHQLRPLVAADPCDEPDAAAELDDALAADEAGAR